MESRNDLVFHGSPEQLDNLVSRLAAVGSGWTLDTKYSPPGIRFGRTFPGGCFVAPPGAGQSTGVRVFLSPRAAGELYVTTITGGDRSPLPLSSDEYNGYLAGFAAFASPHAAAAGVRVTGPGPRRVELREYTSPAAAALAEQFVSLANRGNLHPLDRTRLNAFVIRAYQDEAVPDRYVIHDWLAGNGWDESQIGPAVDDYETAVELLSQYDDAVSRA